MLHRLWLRGVDRGSSGFYEGIDDEVYDAPRAHFMLSRPGLYSCFSILLVFSCCCTQPAVAKSALKAVFVNPSETHFGALEPRNKLPLTEMPRLSAG